MMLERYSRELHEPVLRGWHEAYGYVFDPDVIPAEGYVAVGASGPLAMGFVFRDPTASVLFIDNFFVAPGAQGLAMVGAARMLVGVIPELLRGAKACVFQTKTPILVHALERLGFACEPIPHWRAVARPKGERESSPFPLLSPIAKGA